MPLYMPGKSEVWDASRRAVAFPAEDAAVGTPVACAISEDALVDHFGALAGNTTNLLDAFRRYRPAIETAASRKYDAAAKSRMVILDAADFSGAPSAAG